MWSLLGSLISNFLLLRDLFGYAIPGAVLLAIADYIETPDLTLLPFGNDSLWVKAVVLVTAAYVVGHVLAAVGYTFYAIVGLIPPLAMPPEEVGEISYFKYLYPSMFLESDRRETQTILRVTLAVALLAAACLPDETACLRWPLAVFGLFLLWNGYHSVRQVRYYKTAVL